MRAPQGLRLAWGLLQGQASRAWLFIFCVALGVSAHVGVRAFLAQLDGALLREARGLLAADLELSASQPLSPLQESRWRSALPPGTRFSQRVSLLTMASTGAPPSRRSRLVQLSAVDAAYPLAGSLRVEGAHGALDCQFLQQGPRLYCQPTLLAQWGLTLGAKVRLGRLDFTVAGLILAVPGLGGTAFSLGPRVLVGAGSARRAGLAGFGSRVVYEQSALLPDPTVAAALAVKLRQAWGLAGPGGQGGRPIAPGTLQLRSAREAQAELRRFFSRLAEFLDLVALAALLLGGIGVASVTRAFVREAAVSTGILRSLGASPGRIRQVFAWQCLGLGLGGGVAGVLLGQAGQWALPQLLGGLLPLTLRPALAWTPVLSGLGLALLTAIGFGMDPVLAAGRQGTASLLRDEDPPGAGNPALWAWRGLLLAAYLAVAAVGSPQHGRGPLALLGLLGGALMVGAAGRWTLPRLATLAPERWGYAWRRPLQDLGRPGLRAGSTLVALGSAALLLGVLTLYQSSLLAELAPALDGGKLPELFLLDAQTEQLPALRRIVAADCPGADLALSPMVKGRYRGLLRQPTRADGGDGARAQNPSTEKQEASGREQNLSWREGLDSSETVVAGHWIDPKDDAVEASLEEGYAKRLGVTLGDVLRFDVQGVEIQAEVTSLRKVRWISLKPNFFVLLSPWALKEAPQTWVGSVAHSGGEAARQRLQADLASALPNATLIDVADVAHRVMAVLSQIGAAVRLVALAWLLSALAVLGGLALAQARQRRPEAALLKALGATRGQLLLSAGLEYGLLAALAALLGLGLSLGFGWALVTRALDLNFHIPWVPLGALALLFAASGALVGVLASLRAFGVKPAGLLRED